MTPAPAGLACISSRCCALGHTGICVAGHRKRAGVVSGPVTPVAEHILRALSGIPWRYERDRAGYPHRPCEEFVGNVLAGLACPTGDGEGRQRRQGDKHDVARLGGAEGGVMYSPAEIARTFARPEGIVMAPKRL